MVQKQRTLPIGGTQNFRDLGGYTGLDGRTVRYGLLYRSDQLSRLTPGGIADIRELGIQTIVDLRSLPEIKKSPNMDFGARRTLHCDPSAETAELAASFQASAGDEDRMLIESIQQGGVIKDPDEGMLKQYRRFANDSKCIRAFGELMRMVCDPAMIPLVFHCRGGKDRTGFAAMLILGALGVSKEQIIADYMVTRVNRAERTAIKLEQYRKYTDSKEILAYLQALLDTNPKYIETSYDEITGQYESIPRYLTEVLGVSKAQLASLQDVCLLPG